ncbi:MAG: hypothetical protein RLZZ58_1060 [Pseudomonadota bacterium]
MAISDQVKVGSGYVPRTDGAVVIADIDLAGKTAIVTGGYSGIGLETVRALAAKGVRVVVPVRDPARAADALADVPGAVEMATLDLGNIASVRAFAADMAATLDRLDIVINNAGIMATPETRVGPGWESQFGTNHLGHMAMVLGLMDLITRTEGARVVALSSTGHKRSDIRWDDVHFTGGDYEKWNAYGQSKTANALFANALSRRLQPTGGLAFAVHPGGIFTPLQRHLTIEEQVMMGWTNPDGTPSEMAKRGFKTTQQGCSTSLWAATSPLLAGKPGVYCEDLDIAVPTNVEAPTARFTGVDPHACDDASAERLWDVSMAMLAAV